jgi:hypothetical protein
VRTHRDARRGRRTLTRVAANHPSRSAYRGVMDENWWVAAGSIANWVMAALTLAMAFVALRTTKWAAKAAKSAAAAVELELNATKPLLTTSGGGADYHAMDIAIQTIEGAHHVHKVEMIDIRFVPDLHPERAVLVPVNQVVQPTTLVQPARHSSVSKWPVLVDETQWPLFRFDVATLGDKAVGHSKWGLAWRLRVEVSPTRAGDNRRTVVVESYMNVGPNLVQGFGGCCGHRAATGRPTGPQRSNWMRESSCSSADGYLRVEGHGTMGTTSGDRHPMTPVRSGLFRQTPEEGGYSYARKLPVSAPGDRHRACSIGVRHRRIARYQAASARRDHSRACRAVQILAAPLAFGEDRVRKERRSFSSLAMPCRVDMVGGIPSRGGRHPTARAGMTVAMIEGLGSLGAAAQLDSRPCP